MHLWTLAPLAGVIMAASLFGNAEGNGNCAACIDVLGSDLCVPILERVGEQNGCQTMDDPDKQQKCMAEICKAHFLLNQCEKSCNDYVQSCPVPVSCKDIKLDCKEDLERMLSNFWKGEECHLEQCKRIVCYNDYFVENCRKTCQPHTHICSGECSIRSDDKVFCDAAIVGCPYFDQHHYLAGCVSNICNERSDVRRKCPQICKIGCKKELTEDTPPNTPFFDFSPSECYDASSDICELWLYDYTNATCDEECACKTKDELRNGCRKTCYPYNKDCKARCDDESTCEEDLGWQCTTADGLRGCPKKCGDPKCTDTTEGNDGDGNDTGETAMKEVLPKTPEQ